ncbi:MAG: hypothetical protein QM485_02500, partial [Flavobacteriaceae bacterium]
MKLKRIHYLPQQNTPTFFKGFLLVVLFFLATTSYGQATATIAATQNPASEAGLVSGEFTVSITGAFPGASILVNLAVSGTATSGIDYVSLLSPVGISADVSGNGQATLVLNVLQDFFVEGDEQVVVDIAPNGLVYTIGSSSTATVTISDNDTAGFTVTQTGGSTQTSEPNVTDSFSVVLTSAPIS